MLLVVAKGTVMNPIISSIADLPSLDDLPRRLDRKTAAQIVSHYYFPISPRTLEKWPVAWRRVNGRALVETGELIGEAMRRVDASIAVRGGSQPNDHLGRGLLK